MREKILVGIIDDDESKITNIMTNLIKDVDSIFNGIKSNISRDKKEQYEKYELVPIEIKISNDIDIIIGDIKEKKIDVLIVDYKLNSFSNLKFSGVDLIKKINDIMFAFPVFMLTSYEEDLYCNEIFDSYQVFAYDRYMEESSETLELNYKILNQFLMYKKQVDAWEQRLLEILPNYGKNSLIDDEILDLDYKLSCNNTIPKRTKRALCSDKMDEFLEKLEGLLKNYD